MEVRLMMIVTIIVFGIVGASFFTLLNKKNPSKRFLRINQVVFLVCAFSLIGLAEGIKAPNASLQTIFVSTITSQQILGLLAVIYFVIKLPTKADLEKLYDELKELRVDFKEHMKQYHQK